MVMSIAPPATMEQARFVFAVVTKWTRHPGAGSKGRLPGWDL
jgi:hypothetical protein